MTFFSILSKLRNVCTWNLLTPPTGHSDGGSPLATTCLRLCCGELARFQCVRRFTGAVDVRLRLTRVASCFTAAERDVIRRGRSEVGADQFAWSCSHSGHVLRRWNSARTILSAPPRLPPSLMHCARPAVWRECPVNSIMHEEFPAPLSIQKSIWGGWEETTDLSLF